MIDVTRDFPFEKPQLDSAAAHKVQDFVGWFQNPHASAETKCERLEGARADLEREGVSLDVVLLVSSGAAAVSRPEAVRTAATELFVQTWVRHPGVSAVHAVSVLKDFDARLTPGRAERGGAQEFFPDHELGILARLAVAATEGRWAEVPTVRGHALGLIQTLAAGDVRLIPQLMAPVFDGLSHPDSKVYFPAQSALRVLLEKGGDAVFEKTVGYMHDRMQKLAPAERRAAQLAVAACVEVKKQPLLQFFSVIERGLGDGSTEVSGAARAALALILLDSPASSLDVTRWILEHATSEEQPRQRAVQQALGAWADAGLEGDARLYDVANDKVTSPFNDVAALAQANLQPLRPRDAGPKMA